MKDKERKIILVTGATGKVGGNFIRRMNFIRRLAL